MFMAGTTAIGQVPKTHQLDLRIGRFDKTNRQDRRRLLDNFARSANKARFCHFLSWRPGFRKGGNGDCRQVVADVTQQEGAN
jgi:hypothetical protein